MNSRKLLPIAVLLLLLVLVISTVAAGAAGDRESYYVSIPQESAADAASLGLNPEIALDYGAFHWLVLNASDFDRLADSNVPFEHIADAGTVQITGHRFDPLAQGEPAFPADMTASGSGPGFRLVQFYGPTNDAWLADLEAAGLAVLQYYPHYSYLVWGTEAQVASAAAGSAIRWYGAVHPAYKMNSDLLGLNGLVRNISIFIYNDGNVPATVAAIEALGANVLQYNPAQPDKAFYDAIVELDAAQFHALAKLNTVLWFGFSGPEAILDDEMSSQINAGNYVAGVPFTGYFSHLADLGYDGSGVTWAIIDTGVDYNHPDLGSHIVGGYNYPGACNTGNPGEDCPAGGHGTHVAGIVGGDATGAFTDPGGFLYGLGVAPGYGIFASNSLSAPAWPPAGGWQEHSKRAVLGGAIGGNNSWTTGEGTNHGYQSSERTHDIMVLDGNFDTASVAEPFIEVFSAGNSGPSPSTLTAPKEAKNLVIVASSRNFRVGSIDTISSFSSRGPAVDGRWVPTIATPGEQISSSRNDTGGSCSTPIGGTNNLYAFCSGTSMAAPHASGSIVLATEWWRSFNGGNDPSSAMAKALMVNGAVDMGTADIPNINEGWGRINVTNVISPSALTAYWDLPVDFGDSGESWTMNLGVADPSEPVKVTLAWADAPGAVGANPALVNNLNLTVEVGGSTYLGNVFSGGWSQTGGTADNINNLENVYVQNPSGSIEITVDAANIAGDAILYNQDSTDQSFALVCYNCTLGEDFTLGVTPSDLEVCKPANAVYTVNVGSVLGFDDPVTLDTVGEPAGATTNFSLNPVVPPGSSTLTVGTAAVAAGSYSFDVTGNSTTGTKSVTVDLDLFDTAATASLVSPPDGAINVPLAPTFTWTGTGTSYTIEIATDAGFTNIVESATVNDTMYTSGGLAGNETYYWRVTADNPCGSGVSQTWDFTTVDLLCSTPNLSIPDNNPTGVTNDLLVGGSGTIDDLEVSIDVTHTWVGDLVFELEHVDTGTSVTFYDRPGVPGSTFGCSGNDIDAVLDDEAASPVENECGAGVPSIAGTFIPNNLLAAFDGEDIAGTWRITASDLAGGDTGVLNEWCVEAVTSGGEAPDIFVDPLAIASTQNANTVTNWPLDIENVGTADLNWDIDEDNSVAHPISEGVVPPANRVTIGDGPAAFSGSGLTGPAIQTERETPAGLTTITHSASQSIVPGNSVSCNNGIGHTDNSYLRIFDLESFGITGAFDVVEVEIGIESATGPGGMQPATMNLYLWDDADPFTFANLTPIGSAGVTVFDGDSGTVITVPVAGSAPAGSNLVVEFFTPDGQATSTLMWVGSNPSGQTAPTYLAAADCGVPEPTDTAALGFPGMHLVMNVTGDTDTGPVACDAPEDIPWASVAPTGGTTAPGNTDTATVTFDSTGLAAGTYTGALCVTSNDPDPGPGNGTDLVIVDLELTVEVPTDVSLSGISGDTNAALMPLVVALTLALVVGFGLLLRRRATND